MDDKGKEEQEQKNEQGKVPRYTKRELLESEVGLTRRQIKDLIAEGRPQAQVSVTLPGDMFVEDYTPTVAIPSEADVMSLYENTATRLAMENLRRIYLENTEAMVAGFEFQIQELKTRFSNAESGLLEEKLLTRERQLQIIKGLDCPTYNECIAMAETFFLPSLGPAS